MIIDVHGHLFRDPEDLDRIVEGGLIEQVWLLDVSFYGDTKVWCGKPAATQQEVLQVAEQYPGFFVPFGYLDFRKPPEVVQELFDMGFQGLKAIFPPKPYDDASYLAYYEKAEALGMPILFHTGMVNALPYRDAPKGLSQASNNMTPMAVHHIAASFPGLTIIGAHLGGQWSTDAAESLRTLPNVYYDISGGNKPVYQKWLLEHLHWVGPLREGGRGGFANKVLMGVDAVYGLSQIHDDVLQSIDQWKCFFDVHAPRYTWGSEVEKIMRLNAKSISFPKKEKQAPAENL